MPNVYKIGTSELANERGQVPVNASWKLPARTALRLGPWTIGDPERSCLVFLMKLGDAVSTADPYNPC